MDYFLKNKTKNTCTARARRARARAARDGWLDVSTVNNSGSKLKIRLVGPLGNLLLFTSMGRVSCESKYPRKKVEIIMYSSTNIFWGKLHAPRARRLGRRDESTVNNSGSTSKFKIRLIGPLGNLLLFPSMGRVSCESKYPRRKVEMIIAQYSATL
jgi:hypothetical protein